MWGCITRQEPNLNLKKSTWCMVKFKTDTATVKGWKVRSRVHACSVIVQHPACKVGTEPRVLPCEAQCCCTSHSIRQGNTGPKTTSMFFFLLLRWEQFQWRNWHCRKCDVLLFYFVLSGLCAGHKGHLLLFFNMICVYQAFKRDLPTSLYFGCKFKHLAAVLLIICWG